MGGRAGTRSAVSTLILVVVAALGLSGGALTARVVDESTADPGTVPDGGPPDDTPADLVYYAGAKIHDGETRQHHASPNRGVVDLARTATGWAIKEEGVESAEGWLILRSGGDVVFRQKIGAWPFDVSADGSEIAYADTWQVYVRSTKTGRLINKMSVGLYGIERVFYSGDDLVIGGTNNDGMHVVTAWDAHGAGGGPQLPYEPLGKTTLRDVSASGEYAVIEDITELPACPLVVGVDQTADTALWGRPCGRYAAYDHGLSPTGRYLLTYPARNNQFSPGAVEVIDLRDSTPSATVDNARITGVGWYDDDSFLVADITGVAPETYRLALCSVDGGCEQVAEAKSEIVIGQLN